MGAPLCPELSRRVARLRPVPVAQAAEIARGLPRYESLCAFLRRNQERCYLATGNLDVWIAPLVRELGLEGHCFSSVARVERGYVTGIDSLLDKAAVLNTLPRPIAAVGDGINDLPMLLGQMWALPLQAPTRPHRSWLRRPAMWPGMRKRL